MGWGVSYKYDGYLSRITKSQLDSRYEECKRNVDALWNALATYAASTPPVTMVEDEIEHPYPEWIARKISDIREELEENMFWINHIQDCMETIKDNPDSVTDD